MVIITSAVLLPFLAQFVLDFHHAYGSRTQLICIGVSNIHYIILNNHYDFADFYDFGIICSRPYSGARIHKCRTVRMELKAVGEINCSLLMMS